MMEKITRMFFLAAVALTSLSLLGCPTATHAQGNASEMMSCTLVRKDDAYHGSCAVTCSVNALGVNIDGIDPVRGCKGPPRVVNAMLKETARANVWIGTMEGKFPEDPTRFELLVHPTGGGVAKMPFGWFALNRATIDQAAIALDINADRTMPPNQDDIRIIRRALTLLRDASVWNRKDDRICRPNPTQWSLFCALTQATEEVSGGVHYRQPALQVAREVLNEVGGSRLGKHRLMDYNNHPDTTLAEIHALLNTAEQRLRERFR